MAARVLYPAAVLASILLILASVFAWLPTHWTEAVAFVTGGWCVWLAVKESIWNWPIGIANCTFSGIVFYHARLYADTGLQIVYLVLAFIGWYWWLFGGTNRSALRVRRIGLTESLGLLAATAVMTWGMREALIAVNGSAPFFDALTTAMSLSAQYMLIRKYLENWVVWIAVDLIYVPLYVVRGLPLMAILYAVFLAMAFSGYAHWRARLLSHSGD